MSKSANDVYLSALEEMAEENYSEAVTLLESAISIEKNVSYSLKLAMCQYKLGKFEECLQAANDVLEEESDNAKAILKKGQALFALSRYEEVIQTLKASDTKEAKLLVMKAEAELEDDESESESEQEEEDVKIEEVEAPSEIPKINTLSEEDFDPEDASIFSYKIDHYQSNTFVTISVMAKNIQESDLDVTFDTKSLMLRIGDQAKKIKLFSEIIPEESSFIIRKTKIEIKVRKAFDGMQWLHLEAQMGNSLLTETSLRSAYSSKKNWEKVEQLLAKAEENEKPEGDEALNKLFQDIYSRSSEETRMAMNKSFQTSGGTVLSTSWDEVSKKDYEKERTAPDGMEWKNWEGEKIAAEKKKAEEAANKERKIVVDGKEIKM